MSAATIGLEKVPSAQVVPAEGNAPPIDSLSDAKSTSDHSSSDDNKVLVPLSYKLASILFVSAIGFGSSWSSGITGAMKTTIKKVFISPLAAVYHFAH